MKGIDMTRLSWLSGFAAITLLATPLLTTTANAVAAETKKVGKYKSHSNAGSWGVGHWRDHKATVPNPGKPKKN
jgi:hypothetical protein